MKFVVRLQKMLEVFGIPDSWKIGMREDMQVVVVPHQTGVEGVGGGNHSVTS